MSVCKKKLLITRRTKTKMLQAGYTFIGKNNIVIRSSVVVLRGEDELPCNGVGVLCHLFGRACGY